MKFVFLIPVLFVLAVFYSNYNQGRAEGYAAAYNIMCKNPYVPGHIAWNSSVYRNGYKDGVTEALKIAAIDGCF